SESDKTFTSLLDALHKAGDPFVRVSLASYRPAAFRLAAKIKRDPAHDAAKVDAAVESALRDAFSFERRGFGEPVHLSAVVAVMQSVAGVLAVDVDALYRGAARKRHTRLDANQPHVDAQGRTRAAELLTLAEGPLDYLEEMP